MAITSVCLLQLTRISIPNPIAIAKQRNATDISWIIVEIVGNRASLSVNAFDPGQLCGPVVQPKGRNPLVLHGSRLWVETQKQAVQSGSERWNERKAG